MLDGFNNTWGIIRELGVPSAFLISTSSAFANTYIYIYIYIYFLLFPAQVLPEITNEQESFIKRVLKIPFNQRKLKDLVTLDTIHTFYSGLVPMPEACRLQAYTHHHKFFFLAYLSSISTLFLTPAVVLLCFLFQRWT